MWCGIRPPGGAPSPGTGATPSPRPQPTSTARSRCANRLPTPDPPGPRSLGRLEHYDDVLSRSPHLDRLADQARRAVAEFAAAGDFYISVSWGKDSVAAAFLALQVAPGAILRWARAKHV